MDNHACKGMNECCFYLVLLARLFTHSLPARIQWLTRSKPLKLFFFETAVGDARKQLHFDLNLFMFVIFTPHAQRERGKVIDRGVHIYIYMFVDEKNI